MMLKIAVCDDEPAHLEKTTELLGAYFRAHPALTGEIFRFSNGRVLLAEAEKRGGFEVYILDIIMPELNGIQIAQRLREMGDGGEIVYLTTSSDFAVDSYAVRAFFYLIKPVTAEKLCRLLDEAVEKRRRRQAKGVLVDTAAGARRILLDHILYVERVGRRMRYYCTDGPVDSRTIHCAFRDAVRPLLEDRRFCLCGASFLVNLEHVTGVDGREAVLDNGERLALPRSAATFKDDWGKFWLEEGAVCPIG